jgi:cell division septal protein FtsQ
MEGRAVSNALSFIRRTRKKRRPSRAPRWRLPLFAALGVAAACAVGLALHAFATSEMMRVQRIIVEGTARIPADAVRSIVEGTRGEPILALPLDELRARVEGVVGVRSAVVARRLPDLVQVHVSERRAVARAHLGGVTMLVGEEGHLFPQSVAFPGDADLPLLEGLRTPPGTPRLVERDRPALDALAALVEVTGERPPPGTRVDVSPQDRIVLRPGPEAPALWLDRHSPEMNLENLFAWKGTIAELAPGRPVDLRFPHRLTVAAPEGQAARR